MSPRLPIALAAAAIAFVAGYAADLFAARAPARPGPAPAAQESLPALRDEIRQLQARLAAGGGSVGLISKAEIAESLASIRARLPDLIAARNGRELLALMWALAILGEEGYAASLELADVLHRGVAQDGEDWGITNGDLKDAFCGPMVSAMIWAITHPETGPSWIREFAAWELNWTDGVDTRPLFLYALEHDPDPEVLFDYALLFDEKALPEDIPAIDSLVRLHAGKPKVAGWLLRALGSLGTEESERLLVQYAGSSDERIRAAGEYALNVRHPPATGALVGWITPGSAWEQQGFRMGDILLSYDGQELTSDRKVDHLMSTADGSPKRFRVLRAGRIIEIEAPLQDVAGAGELEFIEKKAD